MHPAFYVVDHRIDRHTTVPFEEKSIVKRGAPERLRLDQPHPGAPFVQYTPIRAVVPARSDVLDRPQADRASWLVRLLKGLRHAPAT